MIFGGLDVPKLENYLKTLSHLYIPNVTGCVFTYLLMQFSRRQHL
ncbi:hypothetical protein Mucpa_2970 [Mucilaginibacter paludis DSM 18603]|uniref:Uncharacterized protein n=1 Tax=Mucilaginibacter paludis DSM 18603 TaxID=714943 RepID=H1YC00_9SPHI|nr:hypothetical protein Mucpa_2970 [Mucilaginibacter paludis DSM 18603]